MYNLGNKLKSMKWNKTDLGFALTLFISMLFVRSRKEHYFAGFGAMIIEDYTAILWGTLVTRWPPDAGPYYEPYVTNWPVVMFMIVIMILWIHMRRNR